MATGATEFTESIREAIRAQSPDVVVAEHVLERVPHIFRNDWALYRSWRGQLASRVQVDPCDISIIGSACVGASLSPQKGVAAFSERSDVDVAVISPYHFDVAWRTLRAFALADARTPRERQAVINHRNNYIYWGCIAIDKILRIMPFAKEWAIASSHMRGVDPTAGRDVKFRIYRDFDSLRSYQTQSVKLLRAELMEAG